VADMTVVDKALAYIVSGGRLLVLRHVDHPYEQIGLQVPGGTVRPGEAPARAARREAGEETGLSDLVMIGEVGQARYDISPLRLEIQRRHFFHFTVRVPFPSGGPAWSAMTACCLPLGLSASGYLFATPMHWPVATELLSVGSHRPSARLQVPKVQPSPRRTTGTAARDVDLSRR
jgi:8-oxo-dGTP pyrophosphatase MutT (NUDIX family)